MGSITYVKLTNENFNANSLDKFVRHQEVRECWRRINGELVLVPNNYVEDWDLRQRRKIAETIYNGISGSGFAYGALAENKIVGYIYMSKDFFGTAAKYIELKLFYVSEPFRCKGIGKELFKLACSEAKNIGAEKLYISAHSSKESQAAYRRLGCVEAEEINRKIAEEEPFDIQMEYCL